MQRFSETSYQVSDVYKNKITHAEFKAENTHFYNSDGFENEEVTYGNGIGITGNFDKHEELKSVYKKSKIDG